jgi:multidrug efflux system outer membrane protein
MTLAEPRRAGDTNPFWRSGAILCALALLCTACAANLPVATPASTPAQFEQATGAADNWPAPDWYRAFASAELDELEARARASNLDLAAAEARIRQADARARAAGAAILPQFGATSAGKRISGGSGGRSASETDWAVLLSASYEIDFWGANRAVARSARLAAASSQAERDTVELTTLSAVANGYFQVLSLRERLAIARDNLASARAVLQVIDARFGAGAATNVELATQRAVVANTELSLAPLEQQEIEARGALALLTGSEPEGFAIRAARLEGLSEPVVAPGLPSELLRRRPDIAAAEAGLRAAHADVAAARAAMFPTLNLTADAGIQNPAVQAAILTLEGTGHALSVGASLAQTLFDGGRRRSARVAAEGREQELLANYRAAILSALLDVETALAALAHLDSQRAAQAENLMQSERAFEGARLRLRAGAGDYLGLLEAQRMLFAAREQASQYALARLQAVVALCKALGGGWQRSGAAPSIPTQQ